MRLKASLQIPLGLVLIFILSVLSEYTYNAPFNLNHGLLMGTIFGSLYLLYEGSIWVTDLFFKRSK